VPTTSAALNDVSVALTVLRLASTVVGSGIHFMKRALRRRGDRNRTDLPKDRMEKPPPAWISDFSLPDNRNDSLPACLSTMSSNAAGGDQRGQQPRLRADPHRHPVRPSARIVRIGATGWGQAASVWATTPPGPSRKASDWSPDDRAGRNLAKPRPARMPVWHPEQGCEAARPPVLLLATSAHAPRRRRIGPIVGSGR
jgi:hypothetical protein